MAKKTKRQKAKRRQQGRTGRTVKERKQVAQRPESPPPFIRARHNIPDQQTLLHGFMEMESLTDEPEFADFELGEHAAAIIAEAIASSDDEVKDLDDVRDEERINDAIAQAKADALLKIVTPALKEDIRHRLQNLSHRLRKTGEKERAEGIEVLAAMLDQPVFPWLLFGPVQRAFDNMTEDLLGLVVLHQALAQAAGRQTEDISPEEWEKLLSDPEVMRRFGDLYESDEILQDVVDLHFDKIEDAVSRRLYNGEIELGLFDDQELILGLAWHDYETEKTEEESVDDEEEEEELKTWARLTIKAAVETLTYLSTPERQQRWAERLEQAIASQHWEQDVQTGLNYLLNMLQAPDLSEAPGRLFVATYLSELRRMEEWLATDSSETEAQEARVQQFKERLARGEPPLEGAPPA